MRRPGTAATLCIALVTGIAIAMGIAYVHALNWRHAHPRTYAPPLGQLVDSGEDEAGAMIGQRLRTLLANRGYDRLEAFVDSLRVHDCRTPAGRSAEFSFYDHGFGEVDDERDPREWTQHLALIRSWADGHLDSPVPRIALAHALFARAWAARGGDWGEKVTQDRWQRFAADMTEANALLDGCSRGARRSAAWLDAKMLVLHAHGLDADTDAEYRATYAEAVQRYPGEPRWYTGMSNHLMRRFGGLPGEFTAYADTCGSALPDSLRDELYARIVENQCTAVDNPFTEYPGLSWKRIQRGLGVWERRWPASITPSSARARLAVSANDPEAAVAAFQRLSNRVDLDVWGTHQYFLAVREWAFADLPWSGR